MLSSLIGGFISIIIGVNLMPIVADQVYTSNHGTINQTSGNNVTGAASTVISLTTLFFALGILSMGVALSVSSLRQSGLI